MKSNFDTLKMAVEGTSPSNTILYDDMGLPSFMVRIPKFKVSEVIVGGSDATHPAFIVDGVEVPEIFISKYQNIVKGNRAYSLPGQDPCTHVTFDQAKAYCENKGKGWHLMSNAEWAAISLWCQKNGFLPCGNTSYGKHHIYTHEHGVVTYTYGDSATDGRVATGSGPVSWAHNNRVDGIFDLCGNIWEWISGLRLLNGQIQVIPNNNSGAGVDESAVSTLWKGISADDTLIDQDASGGLYFDSSAVGDAEQTEHVLSGAPILNTFRTNPQYTVEDTGAYYGVNSCAFKALAAQSGVVIPELLRVLGLLPLDGYDDEGAFFLRNYGERLPLRGGRWTLASGAGVCTLNFGNVRTYSTDHFGFRAAFVTL